MSVATFVTETTTTDHASNASADIQEVTDNVSELMLRNMQVSKLARYC